MNKTNPVKKGRGVSAMRIIQHRKVHELHRKYLAEEGEKASFFPKSYYAEKIADDLGYKPLTVSRIMNEKFE